ncbi:MAG: DegV family EDD domain-containing protein [Mycoplasmataceae bacterium]|nr:DegV family EDD domain-containing protein [Mycoplasmataceae bacterium]
MNEWGIILDSSCGYTRDEMRLKNIGFVPFKIRYGKDEFDDGINIFTDDIAKKARLLQVAKTSVPSLTIIEDEYDKMLQNYENLIVVPLSRNLSGMNNAMRLVAQEEKYNGKVYVLESNLFGNWIEFLVPRLIKWRDNNHPLKEVIKIIENYNESTFASVMIDDLQFLSAGGRISQSQARIGSLAGVKPVLVIRDGKIDENESYKTRNTKKALDKICNVINDYIEDNSIKPSDYYLQIPYIGESEDYANVKKIVKSKIKGFELNEEIKGTPKSIVLVYTGVNTTGIGLVKKID